MGQDLPRWLLMERLSGREGIDYWSHLMLQAIGIKLVKVQEGLDWSHRRGRRRNLVGFVYRRSSFRPARVMFSCNLVVILSIPVFVNIPGGLSFGLLVNQMELGFRTVLEFGKW